MADSATQPSSDFVSEGQQRYSNTTNACSVITPTHLKGSFSSKFSYDNSKAGAYVVENMKIIDRTVNAAIYAFGIDYEVAFHEHTGALTALHMTSGIYDFIYGKQSPYSPTATIFYAANANTNIFSSIENIPLKCTIEGSYALLRGYPDIPSLLTPSASLVGAGINTALCINREMDIGQPKSFIGSSLTFIKAMLQAKNDVFTTLASGKIPLPELSKYRADNLLVDIKEMWAKQDPALVSKILAYTKAAWNLVDMEAAVEDIFSSSKDSTSIESIENAAQCESEELTGVTNMSDQE